MKFGDKARFAIEFELDDNHGGSWLFGRFCYWIGGEMVGDYCSGVSLRDVLFQMKYVVGDGGQRTCPKLAVLPPSKIVDLITMSLSELSNEISHFVDNEFLPAKLDVRIPVDIFNSWNIFLVDGDGDSLLMYSRDEHSDVNVVHLLHGEFDTIAVAAYDALDQIYLAQNGARK